VSFFERGCPFWQVSRLLEWLDSFAVVDFGHVGPECGQKNLNLFTLQVKDLVIAIERKRVHVMPTHSPVLGFLLVSTATHAKSLEALGLCAKESLPRVDWHHKGCRVTFVH
jgi:hypothetical protein